jgi:hypothetical protein
MKPELGISKAWGPLTLEIAPSVTFYTKNDDFLNGMTREQDSLYAVQGHLVYSIGYGIWAALDSTYYMGGRTKVNGIANDDRQENWRLGGTLSVPISRHHSIKLYGSTGVSTRTGSESDAVGILLQYRWGQGLQARPMAGRFDAGPADWPTLNLLANQLLRVGGSRSACSSAGVQRRQAARRPRLRPSRQHHVPVPEMNLHQPMWFAKCVFGEPLSWRRPDREDTGGSEVQSATAARDRSYSQPHRPLGARGF